MPKIEISMGPFMNCPTIFWTSIFFICGPKYINDLVRPSVRHTLLTPLTVSEFRETWSVYVFRWKKRPGIGCDLIFSLFTKIGAKNPQKWAVFCDFWMWNVRSQRWAEGI